MTSDEQSGGANRRRQTFSFSVTLRPSIARRARIVRPPAPPLTCEESAHYPIFNPQNPRHNPIATIPTWGEDGYYASQHTDLQSPVSWPKRSLRRARSGLVALRAGVQRRAAIFSTKRHSSDATENSSDQDGSFPSTISEASTEEDSDFGTHLHRTECNDSSSLSCDVDKCLDNWPFSVTITDLNPFHELTGGYCSPSLFLTETANSIFPRDSTEGQVLGARMSRDFTTGDYIQLDDYYMNESDSQSGDSNPGLRRSSNTLPEPDSSLIADVDTDTDTVDSTILGPLSNNPIIQTSPQSTDINGDAHLTVSRPPCASSPELPKSLGVNAEARSPNSAKVGQPPTRFYASRAPQVSKVELIVASRGLIDRVSGQSEHSIGDKNSETNKQSLEPVVHQGLSPHSQAERVDSDRLSTTEDSQAQKASELRTSTNTPSNPVQTVLALGLDPATVEPERQSVNSNGPLSRPSGDTGVSNGSDLSGEQAPWLTRPSDEATTTDLTSVSNNLWSPIENGDLTSLLSFTDEYFYVDGKTSGHPDRGDNPTKVERSIVSDGSLYSGLGLDRSPSLGTLDIPEIIGPGRPIHAPSPRPYRVEREASDDSIDEYLLTYPMYQRRYFS
ncbi:hypothetical protein BBP40_005192 [Aspergillus hancockii]|nr:hypothetical protein BBP40_005192 [Aspergillus hancockii]